MNNKINNSLTSNYTKVLLNSIFIPFWLGLILNLFEEVEFFKNSGESLYPNSRRRIDDKRSSNSY